MAEPPQQTAAAAFPAPPVFYKNFTLENQRKLEELQAAPASTQSDDGSATESKETASQSLPPELLCLIPPKPPTEGQYRSFGDTWNIPDRLPTLKELDIPQLFPEPSGENHTIDRAQELRRLCKSLLLSYLELVGVMSVAPSDFQEKVYHLRIHLINIHQLINEYRPHQARETLISMMEEQLERSRKETEENRRACVQVRELMASLREYSANGLISATDGVGLSGEEGEGRGSSTPEDAGLGNGAAAAASSKGATASGGKSVGGGGGVKDEGSWEALGSLGLA